MSDTKATGAEFDRRVLAHQLWEGDESDVTVLRNAMVIAGKPHQCSICFQPIARGERVRAQAEIWDGQCQTFWVCAACCRAIVASDYDDGRGLDARYQLGIVTAAVNRGKQA